MSVSPRGEMDTNSGAKSKERQLEKSNSREERRLFLNCSRENLSISDIEQGFNKNHICIRINKNVMLNVFIIILVCICVIFETFNLSRVLDNRRDIEIIKQDLETLRRQVYDESFLDRLMAFEDQWYEDTDDDDDDDDDSSQDLDDDDDDYDDYTSKGSSTPSPQVEDEDMQKILEDIRDLEIKKADELRKNFHENQNKTLEAVDDGQRHKRFIYSRINNTEINLGQNLSHDGMEMMKKGRKSLIHDNKKYFAIEKAKKERVYRKAPDDAKKLANTRGLAKRHLRMSRQIFAAHYGADSSLFSEDDEHTGNGRARHNEGVFKAWRSSDWMDDFQMERHFSLSRDGKLTVHESGLYFVYAQIHYLDEHDENGFHLLVNGKPILQCMAYSPGTGHKSRSCFSAQVTFLHSGDRLVLKDIGIFRYTLFQKDKSFFGLVKLGDLKVPHTQLQSSSESPMNE